MTSIAMKITIKVYRVVKGAKNAESLRRVLIEHELKESIVFAMPLTQLIGQDEPEELPLIKVQPRQGRPLQPLLLKGLVSQVKAQSVGQVLVQAPLAVHLEVRYVLEGKVVVLIHEAGAQVVHPG